MADMDLTSNPIVDEASEAFLGQWNQLVSTTNWEKGRIILAWRNAMIAAGADVSEYADEAWSRRVGNVTGQHVGRLRRVYERFGANRERFGRLYWSHFQAALDWDDAETWLDGARDNGWSISEMRRQRWQANGSPQEEQPSDDILIGEIDEDAALAEGAVEQGDDLVEVVRSPARETTPPDDEQESGPTGSDTDLEEAPFDAVDTEMESPPAEPVRPFANLSALPDDLTEAFEGFKLAILRHKMAGWAEVSLGDVLASLDALKQLAQAPAAD